MSDNISRESILDVVGTERPFQETGGPSHNYDSGNVPEGDKYDTRQLQEHFTVEAFAAPLVIVRRKSDGKRGTLEFTHSPRVYFNFQETT